MAPPKERLHSLMHLFIACLLKLSTAAPCLPDQASSLLQLKASFIGDSLPSWQAGTDCCHHWEGVTCDMALERVISLDLGELHLASSRLDPALFNLTSLRNLNLASNYFSRALLPASGFERLTDIIHLDLSYTYFLGQIPVGIACLKNLVTIDLSDNYYLYFERPSFQVFMANMSNLRELYLDRSTVLADSVPQLQVLSLSGCSMTGSIHSSFSKLHSLMTINLADNSELTGKVPEYFSKLSSLTVLDISSNKFEGQFPTKIYQLKCLRTLDLSDNPMLSVRLTHFPTGNNLETLNLIGSNFSYDMPSSFAKLEHLKELGLNTMDIDDKLPALISKLPSLNELQLMGPDTKNPILSWVSNITQLTHLRFDGYDFSKSVSTWIGKLTRLESLTIVDCSFSMPIPYQIGNLTKLVLLEFLSCDFPEQRMPSWIGNLTKLVSVIISDCNFSGPIPSTIGNLIQLEELTFSYSELLYMAIKGKIPKSLFALPALELLRLIDNQLIGSLEDIPAPLSSPLWEINLSFNQLTGPIPKSFFQLMNLQLLRLGSNKLTGTIELGSIWRLKNLTDLGLGNNMISIVEKEGDMIFSHSLKIQGLYLASCNLTKFPASLEYIDTIRGLDLSNNQIEGAIPSWVWEKRLLKLNLSHNKFSSLEKSPIVQMTHLIDLDLSFNGLQGSIPIPSTPSELIYLDYSNNEFSSIEPNFVGRYLRNANSINLSKNKLSGHIPLSVCSLNNLQIMDLSYNYFSGPIPSCLMKKADLMSILRLRENKLHGMLPENIREGCALPRSLANCQDLEVLDVGNNQIGDSFPSWLGTLPKLRILVLRSNQLNGTIRGLHDGYQHFTSLQIVDLASNHFSGDLHPQWFENLRAMMDSNHDVGKILEHQTNSTWRSFVYQDTVIVTFKDAALSVTKIPTAFKVIDFSNNSFDGSIPGTIGRLVSLHGLNIEIPQEFTSLTSLSWLNLSYNNLTGRLPQGNQFLTFPSSSFEGNAGLCGIQLSKQCDNPGPDLTSQSILAPEPNTLWQDRLDAIIFFLFVGLGFGVGFALSIIFRSFYHIEGWLYKHMY
ncbi:hypothetical protein GQ55_2G043800 [Panicum hallii var. hallii]|uniref:Uncharacterized protein n=1 Tax=Panicum hallii var. hallii TaxID=1504633 RepID=A0A2T7ELD3_9POAL|nr:hypothetical protein GQ55_2G043800 [Panicum hallii var. hallii]